MKTRLFYYTAELNFGDLLNELICEKVLNINYRQSDVYSCDAVFIGSLLQCFLNKYFNFVYKDKIKNLNPINVWGTGFIADKNQVNRRIFNLPECFRREMNVHACRGELTKLRLQNILKKDLSNIPIGDPGLLASYLIEKTPSKKYKLGIISHYTQEDNPIWLNINENIKNSIIIDVRDKPEKVLRQISECELIISSAMHGLIVSDALGIPNIRVVLADLTGGDYKFNDYYSALGITNHRKLDLNKHIITEETLQMIHDEYNISSSNVQNIQQNLLKSCPYK